MSVADLVKPSVLEPTDEQAVAALFRDSILDGLPFVIRGGASRPVGKPVEQPHHVLSTAKLSGIVDYEPAEMVMIAKAGTPMAEIEAALAKGRQRMIFEPMDYRPLLGTKGAPTIGGAIASNASGPRRIVTGAARDSLLGVRFVNGTGDIVKTGGRVMKNVTGLDLVKLLCGSWGTLGVMSEVTFKVVPEVETEQTLVLHGLTAGYAATVMAAAMATPCEVNGAAHMPAKAAAKIGAFDGHSVTLLRVEGFQNSVKIRVGKLMDILRSHGEMTVQEGSASRQIWRDIRDVEPFDDGTMKPVWRVSVAPMAGHQLVAALGIDDAFYDWQGGLVWLRMDGDPEAQKVRNAVAQVGGGHATLVRASVEERAKTPVFHPQDAAVTKLSEAIRLRFDPANRLNPGWMG
ncbi:MAG: FAD-binding protein [Pseudomonadota bacterium]